MGTHDFTFYDLICRNAVCFKEKEAWDEVDNGKSMSYSLFKEYTDQLASGLREEGLKKGDRIAVLGKNCFEYLLLFGAASALGAIMMPINWRLSPDEVMYNLNDCDPTLLFAGKEFQKMILELKGKTASIKGYYNLSQNEGDFKEFGSLMTERGEFTRNEVRYGDGFVLIHTAAVAGRPRGALLSHENILLGSLQFDHLLNLTTQDVHLNVLPMFHAGGLFMVIASFQAGALNVNMSGFEAASAVELIESKRVTLMMEFSPMLKSILDCHITTGKDIHSLKSVAGIDSKENIEKYQEITGGTFYCMYGQTETSCVATFGAYRDRPGSAGKVIPMADVRLVDDYDHPVPMGKEGEITIKGPMVFQGYWNLQEDTAYTFRNGWLHTGDLGLFDEEGYLWYRGRTPEKELIKPGGENVYPVEVEKVILEHPAVERVIVFGVPDPKWKEGIKAVCMLKTGKNLTAEGLIDFVGERIARFKKPHYVKFVKDFPLLEDGSLDRSKIKELYGGTQKKHIKNPGPSS